jgi:hypothetical protein
MAARYALSGLGWLNTQIQGLISTEANSPALA